MLTCFCVDSLNRIDKIAMRLTYLRELPITRLYPLLGHGSEHLKYPTLHKVDNEATHRSPAKVLERDNSEHLTTQLRARLRVCGVIHVHAVLIYKYI